MWNDIVEKSAILYVEERYGIYIERSVRLWNYIGENKCFVDVWELWEC